MVEEADTARLLKVGLTSEDARLLASSRPNVVLVGMSPKTEEILVALTPFLQRPVQCLEGPMSFPNPPQGTLILRKLETLDWQAQHQLLRWLDGPGTGTRVISVTSESLYPRVEQGSFLEALYYRLNVVRLEPLQN
jgi:Sigma-54 interaction domain